MDACLDTPQKPAVRKHRASRKLHFLTRESLDGRTRTRKIFDAIARGIAADLQEDQLSTIQKHLIEAFAGAAVRVHDINARLLKGQEPDVLAHSQAISSMVRIASRLPVGRALRDVTPLLRDYIANYPATTQDEDASDTDEEASSP
jgi:hypothetical protein